MSNKFETYQIRAALRKKWTLKSAAYFLNNIDEDLCTKHQFQVVRQTYFLLLSGFNFENRHVNILHERGIDICHETIRYWWNKFGTLFAKEKIG